MHQDDAPPGRSARTQSFSLNGKFLLVTLAVTAIILHGSLYPYDFRIPPGSIGPVTTLLRSWAKPPGSLGEMIANILLYIPFGFFAALALRTRWRLIITTLLGLVLCTGIELTQFYDGGRVTCLSDVCLNTFGTWLGALPAVVVGIPSLSRLFKTTAVRPVPVLLLVAMFGYRLYPYVPTIDLHKYWNSLKPLVLHPSIGLHSAWRYFALWLTICFLISDATGRARSWFLVLSFAAFMFVAKIFIVGQIITPAEVTGGIAAILLWLVVLERASWSARIVALILCAMVVVLRLEPFEFYPIPGSFGWLPFRGFMNGSLGVNVQSFFEKSFLYGSLVWIVARAGLKLWIATVVAAILVLEQALRRSICRAAPPKSPIRS